VRAFQDVIKDAAWVSLVRSLLQPGTSNALAHGIPQVPCNPKGFTRKAHKFPSDLDKALVLL
jgi:hypothetical protein